MGFKKVCYCKALKCILHTRSRGFLYARSLDKLVKFMKFQISIYEVAPSSSLFFSLCMRSFAQSLLVNFYQDFGMRLLTRVHGIVARIVAGILQFVDIVAGGIGGLHG